MAVSSVDSSTALNNYINSQKEAASATTTTSAAGAASKEMWGNFDTYLKVLSAQLANQDPTQPMEASEFTNQLVQYAGIEQAISTNDKLESVLKIMGANGITPLLGYVGQFVEAPSEGKLVVQGGSAKMAYTLPENATSVKIYVRDDNGKVVATMDGMTDKGLNRAVWDGTLDAGGKVGDGAYSFSVVAKNSKGDNMTLEDIRIIGQVTGIETDSTGATLLKVGTLGVKDTTVLSVFGGVTTATNTTTDTETPTDTGA